MMPTEARLGEILEKQGWITRQQLLRALRHQKVVGGKLGTCLLETGAITEERLLRALEEQHGLPTVTAGELRDIPPEVIALVPPRIAERLRAVPFWASKTQVYVALGDQKNLLALDELAFVTGRKVKPFITTELRLAEALERHYKVECPSRFVRLLDRLQRQQYLWKGPSPSDQGPSLSVPERNPPTGPSTPARSESGEFSWLAPARFRPAPELSGLDPPPSWSAPTAPLPRATEPPPASSSSVSNFPQAPVSKGDATGSTPQTAAAPERIDRAPAAATSSRDTQEIVVATDAPKAPPAMAVPASAPTDLSKPAGNEIVAELLEQLSEVSKRALLFRYRGQEVTGWSGKGEGLDPLRLSQLRMSLGVPSVFLTLQSGAPWVRGGLAPLPAHQALSELLVNRQCQDLLVLPLRVRDRLVGALLLEPKGERFDENAVEEAQRAAARASLELEMRVLDRKLRKI